MIGVDFKQAWRGAGGYECPEPPMPTVLEFDPLASDRIPLWEPWSLRLEGSGLRSREEMEPRMLELITAFVILLLFILEIIKYWTSSTNHFIILNLNSTYRI